MTVKKKEKPKHLGRGLQSLLGPITLSVPESNEGIVESAIEPNFPPDKELQKSFRQITIDSIKANPYQPRMVWNEQDIADLAESIRSNGVIQPIIVRPSGKGYELIAGERRLRAAQIVHLQSIPAIVREASDEQMLELALIENIHRTNLNPIERAKAYKTYINTFSLTQGHVANRLSEDRSVIANHLRLLDLPAEIQQMLIDNQLTMGHARAILGLPTDELRRKLANRALAGRLSVREVERLVRKYLTENGQSKRTIHSKPAHILDLENMLGSLLGTKVTIETRKNGQKGKITIEFYSLDDFDRITERIGLTTAEEV